MKIKKLVLSFLALFVCCLGLTGCNDNPSDATEKEQYFDTVATEVDHYFSNQLRFSDLETPVGKNAQGKLEGKFIADKVAKLTLKSVTDGDTAIFYLNGENDTYTVTGKSYPYVTIRFLGIDTPESTSNIDPWGKAASTYAKTILKEAEGIIVDALDLENNIEKNYIDRLDSNGTRWLGLVWYCPKGGDPEDLTQYRSYQLDLIEECYSGFSSFSTTRYGYTAKRVEEPILYKRYESVKNLITGENEKRFGTLLLNELFFEADNRMQKCSTKIRVHGEIDPNYDYNRTPTELSITAAKADIDNLINKGTYVRLTGVITRFVESNFYFEDAEGSALYVYMGIDGNSINDMFNVGDTIKISGRLCEYGGQYQMSGIIFDEKTFTKVTNDAEKIAMPDPIVLTGNESVDEIKSMIGRLVTTEIELNYCGSQSKSGAFSLSSSRLIKGLEHLVEKIDKINYYNGICYMEVRINGQLVPGYAYEDYQSLKTTPKTYNITGIMGIYYEEDYTKDSYASYQIVVGNRYRTDGIVNEIVEKA